MKIDASWSLSQNAKLATIVHWYQQVKSAGKGSKMRNFKDSGLKNSIFLLELVAAIEPRAVDWDVVKR